MAEEQVPLSSRTRLLVDDLCAEWRELDRRISAFDEEFALQARTDEAARLLTTIPGIGPLNATALVAAVGKAETVGDQQARQRLPAQDADPRCPRRAALPSLSKAETPLGGGLRGLSARTHVNAVVVALAAKLAQIVCAVLRSGQRFEMKAATVS